jgi:hypothetical protein
VRIRLASSVNESCGLIRKELIRNAHTVAGEE